MGCLFTVAHDDFDEYNMHVLAAPTCNYYERGTTSPPLYVSNMIKLQENLYDAVYRPENLAILKYCYANYEFNSDIDAFIEKVSAVQEETNILQESMEEEIDETVSSLDEKDEEESEEQMEEEWISYPCPPSNEINSSTHTLFNFPSCLPKDDCYDD